MKSGTDRQIHRTTYRTTDFPFENKTGHGPVKQLLEILLAITNKTSMLRTWPWKK